MPAYLFQAPTGIAGDITRPDESNVEPAMLKANGSPATFPQAYGVPMVYETGGIGKWIGSSVATDFAGVLVREVPGISGSTASDATFEPTVPNPDQPNGLCVRGYINVKCVAGTPVRGGTVYIQITANGGVNVGDLRADGTDGGNAVALTATQAEWATDGKDADNNAELRIAR